jgi:hypothetical protein
MVINEVQVRRRQFLLTGLASVLAAPAAAQEEKANADLDLEPVKGTEELWYLLTALDTLIFCLAVAVIKEQAVIIQARREIQPYSSQLSDPKAEDAFNAALKSGEGQARVEQNKTAIINAAKEIEALLTDVVSPPIRMSVVHAFSRSSTLLIAPPRTSRGGAGFTRSGRCGANEKPRGRRAQVEVGGLQGGCGSRCKRAKGRATGSETRALP